MRSTRRLRAVISLAGALGLVPVGVGAAPPEVRYVDAHAHLEPTPSTSSCDLAAAEADALLAMETHGIRLTVVMSAPTSTVTDCGDFPDLAAVVGHHPDRFALMGGGGTLNPMIHAGADASLLEVTALDALTAGAVGFGEVVAEHFSFRAGQPYLSTPPDHPLFLLLADIAGRYGVPIDLHMEALSADTPRSALPLPLSADNPDVLPENIFAFERLLVHNRDARIVWAHAGWDNTGQRTIALMRRLLHDHPNLYMNIKIRNPRLSATLVRPNGPVDENGVVDPDWVALLSEFPTRFVIGTDAKYVETSPGFFDLTRTFLDALPPGLASLVGEKNAVHVYNLDRTLVCHRPGTRAARSTLVETDALSSHLNHGDQRGPCRD